MNTSAKGLLVKVIIADDHPLFRKGLAGLLSNMPFVKEVSEAENGFEVISLLQEKDYDLVLLDINMKGMDGKTTAVKLHMHYPHVKIIAISTFDDVFTIKQMYHAGSHGYLVKNADEEEIVKAIERVMAGEKYFTDEVIGKIAGEPDDNKYFQLPSGHSLSATEVKIIKLICAGKSNKEIAAELDYTKRTIDTYRDKLYERINISGTAELVRFALRNNIIEA